MQHVGIDLGARESQICVRSSDGEICFERRVATVSLPAWLEEQGQSRVILEASSGAFFVADAARTAGHDVRVVPGTMVRALGVGARRMKNDVRDARALSLASCRGDVPSVHIRSRQSRNLKTLCGMRDALVRSRTLLVNTVRGWLRQSLVTLRIGSPESLPERVRRACDALPSYVRLQLSTIEMLNDQIAEADKELMAISKDSPICRRLMSVPGVGPVTAVRFVATVDDVERFDSAHALQNYLGLTPGDNTTGYKTRTIGITKAGCADLRWVLVQSAWILLRTRPKDDAVEWASKVMERRGRKIGIVALARKLAGILFALWRNDTTYQPHYRHLPAVRSAAAADILAEARA